MPNTRDLIRHLGLAALTGAIAYACGSDLGRSYRPLEAQCVEQGTALSADDWQCGAPLTAECNTPAGAEVDFIYVTSSTESAELSACAEATLGVSDPGPFPVGEHSIVVSRRFEDGSASDLCTSVLTVVDTEAPVVASSTVSLWPPNHKMHTVRPSDCVQVTDACDADVDVRFTWASSDEAENGRGDGNHQPDIVFGCDAVELRAERQGPSNGRVYKLGYTATDASGHATDGVCTVVVAHDRSGRDIIDDGEAYRVELDGAECPADGGPASGGDGDQDGDADADGDATGDADGDVSGENDGRGDV